MGFTSLLPPTLSPGHSAVSTHQLHPGVLPQDSCPPTAVPSTVGTRLLQDVVGCDGHIQHSSAVMPFAIPPSNLLPLPPAAGNAEDLLALPRQRSAKPRDRREATSPHSGHLQLGPFLMSPTLCSNGRGVRRVHYPLHHPPGPSGAVQCPSPPHPSHKPCPNFPQAQEADLILISSS